MFFDPNLEPPISNDQGRARQRPALEIGDSLFDIGYSIDSLTGLGTFVSLRASPPHVGVYRLSAFPISAFHARLLFPAFEMSLITSAATGADHGMIGPRQMLPPNVVTYIRASLAGSRTTRWIFENGRSLNACQVFP